MSETASRVMRPQWRGWVLPLLGGVVIALALWARSPAVPNIAFRNGPGVVEAARSRAADQLRRDAAAMVSRLEDAAEAALLAPAEPAAAFAALAGLRGSDPEWGVILYDSAAPISWSGRLRVPVDTIAAPLSVLWTPFYVAAVATRSAGSRRAVAAAVVQALPPADRLASGVADRVARANSIGGFALSPPFGGTGITVLQGEDGAPLLLAEPIALSGGEIRLAGMARWRARVVLAFAVALVAFLAVAARTGRAAERVVAFAVAVGALALIPFNAFSRHSRLFDPSYYFTPVGGPWTANGGVFLFTSIVVALAMIAFVRGRPRVRRRISAVTIALALVAAGFVVVRALAVGIGQPARGATVALWLSWQMPLFLVTLAFVLPIGWVLDTGIRRRRRLTRRSFLIGSLAAGVLAASLVWLTTVGQRIRLAEADVAALNEGRDDYLDALLSRLTRDLQTSPAPANRVELLRKYAESELAIAGYPFALGRWDEGGGYVEGLDLTAGIDDTTLAAPVVARSLNSGTTEWERIPGPLGAVWVAAVPYDAGVTSVVALPRSRLIAASPHAALLGIPEPLPDEPAYSITVAEGPPAFTDDGLRWWRIGRELHADAPLLTSAGPARAHIEIDLRSPEALGQRLVLVALFNLAAAGLLLLLVRASEPGFGRRTRIRMRHWTGSFRSRIIVALFAFFVIPAAAFTVWGYSRLAAENRQLRRLVVRETLHAARVASEQESLGAIAARLRTPLFSYEDGLLTATSDSLMDVLAPLGRTLPPEVQLHLAYSGEVTANWEEKVGDASVMVGYRTAAATAPPVVLAAPARGSDEMMTRRARDIGVLLLFATAVGALGALWLSGIAAHQFSRPIAALRRAARAVARGDRRPPELPRAPSEFEPVFTAFRRMAADLERSRVELARAERVLAWGEMARQVAHEIKNPLTPIRLGVQYLQRARNDARVDFDRVFEENTGRILREIDRLDEIARAFSRYGSAPTELPPPEPVDVTAVLSDLVAFERMAADGVVWVLEGGDEACMAVARREELREVLINIFENARAARARSVRVQLACGDDDVSIVVEDDGTGIASDVLPRIFEPHFSTRTTGSGLGLAISRRLLDAWGGRIGIESEAGRGTTVSITLKAAVS